MDAGVKNYEAAYLISPEVAEDEVFGEAGKITSFIQEAHGLVGRIEEPKKRKLAYPVKKLQNAYFGWTTFAIAPEKLADIDKKIKAEKNVIRYLIAEEVKRPVVEFRPRPEGLPRRPAMPRLAEVRPFTPAPPKEEDKAKIAELDKKLEEILGK